MEGPKWDTFCQFGVDRWKTSAGFQQCGIKQETVALSARASAWLRSSGSVVLPELPNKDKAALTDPRFEETDDTSSDESETAETIQESRVISLAEDEARIEAAMKRLGCDAGSDPGVVPRLPWTTPTDAVWATRHELQCRSVGEVWNLLACSEVLSFDLGKARELIR